MQPRAITARVAYVPGIGFYADGQGPRELRLSYCFPEPERISEGVRRLAGVVEAELDLLDTFGPSLDASGSRRLHARPRPGLAAGARHPCRELSEPDGARTP